MVKKISLLFLLSFITLPNLAQEKENKTSKLTNELLKDGWHRKEIDQLMQFYIQENSGVGSKKDKAFAPLPSPNLLMNIEFTTFKDYLNNYLEAYDDFELNFPEADKTYPITYTSKTEPYQAINREKGLWKHVKMNPTAGRIYDLQLHATDPNIILANPDGDGIFKTVDGGLNWEPITDNIPDRLNRDAYENIIVDPTNFDHVFSISRFGKMFETTDGGEHWTQKVSTNHEKGLAPQFKWVEAFRNADNALIIIGTVTKDRGLNTGWEKGVYRTDNLGETWVKLDLTSPDFQEIAFHKTKPNVLYLANNSEFYKSTDGGKSFKMIKDFKNGNRPIFISPLGKNDADGLYVAISQDDDTQVYFSPDQGASWELRQDSAKKIGFDKGIYGGGGSGGWISFFEVDPFDSNHLIASTVSSCESFDGGVNWEMQSWARRANAQMPDNEIILAPHASHNADNHVLKFHPVKKGLMIKGCDAGIMRKETGDDNWININGSMPAFLWYSVVVNEFGDRYIAGNTQDVNIQTNRYNTWENDRGYEGDAIFMNPSTNTAYFPVAKTEEGEGLNFLEPGMWKMHSWSYPKVAVNYKNLDQLFIAYGRRRIEREPQQPKYLYVSNDRGVSFDRVPNMDDKEVFSVSVSRTETPVLTAFTASDVMQSKDFGTTWETKAYPENVKGRNNKRAVSGSVNPNNPNQLWLGGKEGAIYRSETGGKYWISISKGLPKGDVIELLYHEGTEGDLYALIKGFGVFYLEGGTSEWQLWMEGFNLVDFTEIRIDYPAQKLLASSYGRGLWESDLEKQVERFFTNNLKIRSNGQINGKYVFEIDSDLTIPSYYQYTWTRNGEKIGTDSRILIADKLSKNDVIKVDLSPIYSMDVKTSAEHIVTEIVKHKKVKTQKPSKSSVTIKDKTVNLGYVDVFGPHQNFTVSTWFNPASEGIIAANRRSYYRDAKGWYLEIDKAGKLHFNAAFYQNRSLKQTYNLGDDQSISLVSDAAVALNEWQHIAVAVDRNNTIKLFVNGVEVGSKTITDLPSDLSLNNVFDLTLMADSYGKRKMTANLNTFSIYNNALAESDLLKIMDKGPLKNENLNVHVYSENEVLKSLFRIAPITLK